MVLATYNQILWAVQIIKDTPGITKEQFYGAVLNEFGVEVDPNILTYMENVLITLEYVETNSFNEIRDWVQSLPQTQVEFHAKAIYDKYKKDMVPVELDYQIQAADDVISEYETKLALVDTMILENSDEEERTELLTLLRGMVDATIQATTRRKTEIEQKRAMYPE